MRCERNSRLLILLCALLVAPSLVCAAENLALQRPYVSSELLLGGWTGLTDGVTDSDDAPGCFATSNSGAFPKQVIVDLGAVCAVSKIVVMSSKNGNTKHVALAISADAKNFEQLREYYFPADTTQTLVHSFAARQARYVRVTFFDSWGTGEQGANCLFLRELQVFGDLPAEGRVASGREELRLARQQPATVGTAALGLFRRYRLGEPGKLRVAVLGDSFAAESAPDPRPWPETLGGLLEAELGAGQVEVLNLAAAGQTPADGVTHLATISGTETPDVVLLAYGRDAALAGGDPVTFRNQWQALADKLTQQVPALLVAVTPPPLWDSTGKGAASVLPLALGEEQSAAQLGLPLLRCGATLGAAPDPTICFAAGNRLTEVGKTLVAKALMRLLWAKE
ncbi:MAG TPA: discoidin domain-containing protein [Armatimonadota bacterium]|jgi:hypothetical protein